MFFRRRAKYSFWSTPALTYTSDVSDKAASNFAARASLVSTLTFALSGARLFRASALERAVRQTPHLALSLRHRYRIESQFPARPALVRSSRIPRNPRSIRSEKDLKRSRQRTSG